MKKILISVLLFTTLNSFAQSDGIEFNRKESIRLDSIGNEFHKLKNYKEAIFFYNRAIALDSTNGEAILHRAISLGSSGTMSGSGINICNEFQKAYDYGAKHVDEAAFFYGCKFKKRKKE